MSENPTMPFVAAYAVPIVHIPDGAVHDNLTMKLPIVRFSHFGQMEEIDSSFGWLTALAGTSRAMRQQMGDITYRYQYYTLRVYLVVADNPKVQSLLPYGSDNGTIVMRLDNRRRLSELSPWSPHVEQFTSSTEGEKPPLEPFVPPLPMQATASGQPEQHPDDALIVEVVTVWGQYANDADESCFSGLQRHLVPTYASRLAISGGYLERLKQRVISTIACFMHTDTARPFSGKMTKLHVLRVTQRYYYQMVKHYTLEQITMVNIGSRTLVIEFDDPTAEQEE